MSAWTADELTAIGDAEELELRSRRRDGTLRDPVTIWVVAHDGALYVRAIGGRASAWFRGTQTRHEGRIRAGGIDKDVEFVEPGDDVAHALDALYRAKYRRYSPDVLGTVLTPEARSATLKLVPRR